jgi:hypothetical protein
MTLNSQEPSGIARHTRLMRLNMKTGNWDKHERDISSGFTTVSVDLRGTSGQLYTIVAPGAVSPHAGVGTLNASAQGVCYGLVLSNNTIATGGTVSIWEGTASYRKFMVFLQAGDVQDFGYQHGEQAPLFKWRPGKSLQARSPVAGRTNAISINMAYWAEEP